MDFIKLYGSLQCRILMPAVMLTATISASAASATLPYHEPFDNASSITGFTIINANNDNNEWEYNNDFKCARISYNGDLTMDDWLITPGFTLSAGSTYKFSLDTKSQIGGESLEVKIGSAPTVEAMTRSIIDSTAVNAMDYITLTGDFTVPAAGVYYIGIHGCSKPDQLYLYVDNLSLVQGINPTSPKAVTGFAAIPDASGLNKVVLSFTTPSQRMDGTQLQSIDKVEIMCDGTVVGNIDNAATGTALTYTHENAPMGAHTYAVAAYSGTDRGEQVEMQVFVGPNIPNQVTNLAYTETTPGTVLLSWDAPATDIDGRPINAGLIKYKVVRYELLSESMFYAVDIDGADALTETQFTHQAIGADNGQMFTAYGVYAYTTAGSNARPVQTALFPVGKAYAAPYSESFANGTAKYLFRSETVKYENITPSWDAISDSNSPLMKSYDADGGYVSMSGQSYGDCARFYSGKIALPADYAPAMSMYVYNFSNGSGADDNNTLELYIRQGEGSQFELVKEFAVKDLPAFGWNRVTVPLDSYQGKNIQFVLTGTIRNYTSTPVDNIFIGQIAATSITAVSVTAPEQAVRGREFTVTARIENSGMQDIAGGYTVNLIRNGKTVLTAVGPELAADATADIEFTDCLSVLESGSVEYSAEVVLDGDADTSDNVTAAVTVATTASPYPVPASLAGQTSANGVMLSWDEPNLDNSVPEAVTDDFESYTSYATTGVGEWTFADRDGKQVGKLQGITIPGIHFEGSTQSFWVMDSKCEGVNELFSAHSGDKYLAQTFNADNSACDDWVISPELYTGEQQTISFYAKSYSRYIQEDFEVLYSTTDNQPASFTKIKEVKGAANEWTKYEAELPAGTKYFAIRCTTAGGYMFFIDDVTYVPAHGKSALTILGYNVYRDGQRINTETVEENSYIDTTATDGEHTYVVTAVFDRGESSASNSVKVIAAGIAAIDSDSSNAPVEYFNLQGVRIDRPTTTGVYIRRQGSSATKIIVK